MLPRPKPRVDKQTSTSLRGSSSCFSSNISSTLSYGNIGCGVSSLGVQNQVDFCLRFNRFKVNFDNFWNMRMPCQPKLGRFLLNNLFFWNNHLKIFINQKFSLGMKNELIFASKCFFTPTWNSTTDIAIITLIMLRFSWSLMSWSFSKPSLSLASFLTIAFTLWPLKVG